MRVNPTLRILAITIFLLGIFAHAQNLTLLSADYGVEGNRIDVTCRVQSLVQNGYLSFRITNYAMGGDPAPEQPKEFRIRARDYRGRIQDLNFREKDDVNLQVTDRGPNCANSGGNGPWQGRLNDDDQQRFDSYYSRWLTYRQRNDQGEILSMENRMRDVYAHYGIPNNVPFDQVASPLVVSGGGGGGGYSDLQILSATYGTPGRTMDVSNRLRSMVRNGSLAVHVNNDSMGGDPAPEKHKVLTLRYSYRGQQRTITVRESDDLNIP
jgi:DnaJ-like protein C11, C-terminal